MKALLVLKGVIAVLFLTALNQAQAQNRKVARTMEGTISNFECGDNCYLTVADEKGKEHIGLCLATICNEWTALQTMPVEYKGRRVRVTIGRGKQYNRSGRVMGTTDAFTRIQLLNAETRVSTPPATKPAGAIITPLVMGKSIRFPIIKLPDQVKADRINGYLKDHYSNGSKNNFRAVLASYDELNYKVVFNTSDILAIEISSSSGRAGDSTEYHFDLSTGYVFTLDQLILPSKLDEIKKLVCDDSKKRFVEVKKTVKRDMETGQGGWTGSRNLWFEKDEYGGDGSYEDRFQREMKKQYWEVELDKNFTLSRDGIVFHYLAGMGFPMSVRELEPNSKYFYSWAVLKPFLMPSSPISPLIK
jgi:hypothetical protein